MLSVVNSRYNNTEHYPMINENKIQCVQKKRLKCFFVISSTKLVRFWWNLVCRFLNKFATKQCKRFPSHLSTVSTQPCDIPGADMRLQWQCWSPIASKHQVAWCSNGCCCCVGQCVSVVVAWEQERTRCILDEAKKIEKTKFTCRLKIRTILLHLMWLYIWL